MKLVDCLLLLALSLVLISCGRSPNSLEECVTEFGERNSQMCQAYLQTDINVAEAGLLSYRSWVTNRMTDPRYQEIAESFADSLLATEGRLWALFEVRRDTNSSARAYERAREVSRLDNRWKLTPISRLELSSLVYCYDAHLRLPWKEVGKQAIPALLRGATNADPRVRQDSLIAMACMQAEPKLMVTVLTNAFTDQSAHVRYWACDLFELLDDEEALPSRWEVRVGVEVLRNDPDPRVQRWAAVVRRHVEARPPKTTQ